LQASHGGLIAPASAAQVLWANQCQVVLITSAASALSMDVYDVPPAVLQGKPVVLQRTATLNAHSAVQAGLGALAHQPAGMLFAVRPDHSVVGVAMGPGGGSPVQVDVPVTVTLLGNGDETSTLVLPAAPLQAGTYLLNLGFHRTRWATTTADPDAVYQDSASLQLIW
jgi:hypothetical protein